MREKMEWANERWLHNLKAFREETEKHQQVTHERMLEMMDRFDVYHKQMRGDAGL